MATTKVQSPLDKSKVKEYITRRISKGVAPTVIVAEVKDHFKIDTTTDSLRRFRQRHGIEVGKAAVKSPAKTSKPKASAPKKSKAPFRYSVMVDGDEKCLTVFFPGETPLVATNETHPNYEEIEKKAVAGDVSVKDLFDAELTLSKKFQKLSERVSIRNGKVYFDGDEQNDALTAHLVRCLGEDNEIAYMAVVKFLENIMTNPNEHSRKQLWGWLKKENFSITGDGLILGYKGVAKDKDGNAISQKSGTAIVNGEELVGQRIPNPIGATVEMPRSTVQHNPSVGCSTGLHVGTYGYAKNFSSSGTVLEVHVNPRDVVSVPTDSNEDKMRCSRYKVINTVGKAYTAPVVSGSHKVA